MWNDPYFILMLIQIFCGFSILLQTLELLSLKKTWSVTGVWTSKALSYEYYYLPLPLQFFINFINKEKIFFFLLVLRSVFALIYIFYPHLSLIVYLTLTQIIISARWRGTFNGGSDYMTLIVLSALLVAEAFSGSVFILRGCLFYIAIQSCFSYFFAGVAKIKEVSWRNAQAVRIFLSLPYTGAYSPLLLDSKNNNYFLLFISWSIIVFELSFPLVFFNIHLCFILLFFAALFHLINSYVFGLNRFFWIWITTYPAIIYTTFYLM